MFDNCTTMFDVRPHALLDMSSSSSSSTFISSRYYSVSDIQYNNKTVLLRDTVHQITQGESAAAGLTTGQPRGRGLPEGDLVDRIT